MVAKDGNNKAEVPLNDGPRPLVSFAFPAFVICHSNIRLPSYSGVGYSIIYM